MQEIIEKCKEDIYLNDCVWHFVVNFFSRKGMNTAEIPIEDRSFHLFLGNIKETYPKISGILEDNIKKLYF